MTNIKKRDESAIISADIMGMFDVSKNLEGTQPRIPSIKAIHQGQLFEMPSGEKTEEFECIIIHSNRINAYWENAFSGDGQLPDCHSFNGIKPVENLIAETCAACPNNKYGSDGGRGKLCKNMRRIHVMIENDFLPYRITIPPSSLKKWDEYMVNLSVSNTPYQLAITEISLSKQKNKDGIEFSEFNFKKIYVINDMEKAMEIKNAIEKMEKQFESESIVSDEFTNEEHSGPDPF